MESQARAEARVSGPRRKLIIERRSSLFDLNWSALWEYRELGYVLIWRDLAVRYKQTAIGVAWVILQPLITMLIFTAVFGRMAKVPSDGVWYPVFSLTALLPWTYFSQAVSRAGESVVTNGRMVSKIYFPRLWLPIAMVISPLVDFALSMVLLFGLLIYAGIPLTWKVATLPVFILLAMLTALGISLFTSAMNVKYRDVGHAIPFVIQIWMFLTPVVYPVSLVPEHWRWLYGLNPMVGVIEGFRWALLGRTAPDPAVMVESAAVLAVVVMAGLVYFRQMERRFADII
ncbi:MAG: Transport permease protein [Candidatus Nitrospira kreftii]|uniref:Transport permease protein n=1 Tax=Candidatus Nitrospira kreftii TaxID=2652173 RepID=A0A7S8FCJ1_9BACT|nr:MAG: Transport permease protein [Candidatus Nitrospira kreftii]